MNNKYKEISLNVKANNYIYELIKNFESVFHDNVEYQQLLVQELIKKTDLSKGTVVTCLPTAMDDESAYNFSVSTAIIDSNDTEPTQGVVGKAKGTRKWLISKFIKHLSTVGGGAIIFKQIYSLPTDSFLSQSREKLLFTNNEVFYLLTSDENNADRITTTTIASDGATPPLLALLTQIPRQFNSGAKLTKEDIEYVVDKTTAIAVSAYDGHGYLIWKK